MNSVAVAVVLAGVFLNVLGSPVAPSTIAIPYPPTPPTGETRALNTNVPIPTCTAKDGRQRMKNGIIDPRFRWTRFLVHPDIAYSEGERRVINDAMYNLMQVLPCIEFGIYPPESNPSGDYIRIIKGTSNGCNSWIGRLGGKQDMNLQAPGCMDVGTAMHEMIHALGFDHEHNRPDRDDFINIYWGNIQQGMEYNFNKDNPSEYTTFGVPYHYRSIMHYFSTAFSSNGQPTMLAKNGEEVGSVGQLQDTDIRKLKAMYNC